MVAMAWRERLSPVFTTFLATAAAGAFITHGLYSGAQPMRVTGSTATSTTSGWRS